MKKKYYNRYYRAFAVYRLFIRVISSYYFYRIIKSAFKNYAPDLSVVHHKNALRIYECSVMLKGTFLKIGQFLSSRMDILPEEYFVVLSELQDNVPPIAYDKMKHMISEELGDDPERFFLKFDTTPFAAASFAQVYKAQLRDDTPVAVKVQFPQMERLVFSDLKLFRRAFRIFHNFLSPYIEFDYLSIVTELEEYIPEELDYEKEAENLMLLKTNFRNKDSIVFPKVYELLSTKKILITDYLDGKKLIDYLYTENSVENKDTVISIMIDIYCQQIFKDGLFQADAHPGNFIVLPGPKIGMVDFGVVKRFSEEVRKGYLYLGKALVDKNAEDMAKCFKAVGFETRTGDVQPLIEFSELFMGIFTEAKPEEKNIKVYVKKIQQIIRENPIIKIPTDFTLLGRALFTISGYNKIYDTNLNFKAIIYPYFGEVIWDEIKNADWKKVVGETAKTLFYNLYKRFKDKK